MVIISRLLQAFALLFTSIQATAATTTGSIPTGSIEGRLLQPDGYPLNITRLTINHGEYSTYTNAVGKFTFHNVGPGVHLLDVHNKYFSFGQVKIQLLEHSMDSPNCIEYVYPGSQKQPIDYPLTLRPHAKYSYFQKRPGISFLFLLKNPMVIIMIMSVGIMYLMPKMMEGMDDEQKEQMKKQMEMQQNITDPSKMLKQLWGDMSGEDGNENSKKVKKEKGRRLKRE
eukprot:CAMPEP_0184862580 /NCGR_PEP_ID=MMETSP0580-20130426/7027_1 /TAXON_ID=1118495 /ORGANISM="Dactyliosolen fragilissimus" /LENGTH=226 /DNA_ID=CAMNT_0027360513 /DNA_START=42 /DNA_END=722 /DNA_ORIENTATION=+